VILTSRQFDIGLISPFGPHEAQPKRRTTVPRAERAERLFAPVEFTLTSIKIAALAAILQTLN
jgi:hypothetical protein